MPYSLGIYIGAPVLLFACSAPSSWRCGANADRLTSRWAAGCWRASLFLVIGVLTPVDMRYYLAALPAVAIAAGYGAAWAWSEGWPPHRALWRVTAALFLAGTISTGFHAWWNALG